MSWKYSSYVPRDLSSSRDSSQLKFGLSHSKPNSSSGDRWSSTNLGDSRFFRSSVEPVEHSPVWAKTNPEEVPTSLQRLKERYNSSEEPRREIRQYKKSETKDLSGSRPKKQYGKTLTTLNLNLNLSEGESSKFSRKLEKAPNKIKSPLESPKVLYMPSATAKLLTRKYSSDLSPTITSVLAKDRLSANENGEVGEDAITVVTRGTSPTPTTSSVYLRSKRSDYGLEKKVPRVRNRAEMANKEVQTEREASLSRYGAYFESSGRSPWSTYGGNSCAVKFSSRSNRLGSNDCRRSVSKEDSENSSTPESPLRSLATKPPALIKTSSTSPVKDSEKKTLGRKSPPGGIRSSLKLDCAKAELAKNPNSPTRLSSPLQCKIVNAETFARSPGGGQSPKVIVDRCPEIADVSSMSESSEEETSSEDEIEEPAPVAMTVKKSVTNFLQNIPNHLPQSTSRTNLYQKTNVLSTHKIHFNKIESGERAWWLESTDKFPEGIARGKSIRSVPHQDGEGGEMRVAGHLLSPPYLLNRQFTKDIDWLRGSSEDLRKTSEIHSPKEDHPPRSPVPPGQGLVNGDVFGKPHLNGNCTSPQDAGKEIFNVTLPVRRRDYSKSPENFLTDELSHAMKFNQQSEEYLTDFQRECAVKDKTQKLQNGLGSPLEDKNFLEPGDMSGMISKAKAGLLKSKTKLDIKKSSSREMSPKPTDTKSEIDLYWKELADSLNRPLTLCDLDFTDLNSDDETDILGSSKMNGDVPPPPPMLFLPLPALPPKNPLGAPTPPTPANPTSPRTRTPVPPPAPQIVKNKKTVKLFWKEVKDEPAMKAKVPDGVTVLWDELAPVKVDTQKLEHLFESRAKDLISKKQQEQNKNKEIIVLDPKRSNAINIGMTKLPPPRSIKTAILKMDATVVNKEGIEKLLTMLPTEEEKLRIQEAQSANPDVPLGSAEQFLSTLASISELEARLRLWAFKLNFENNEKEICEPLMDLKHGMEILRANKTFRGVLATLLSVGNFLNGYDVKGFQIEYLSKVPEVKDTVHKHSLLHHLCLIVMEKFPDSTDLYSEIGAVTRASKVDFDELAANIKKVEEECKLSWNYLKMIAKHEGHTAMKVKMSDFLADCAERIIVVGTVHKRIMNRFQKFAFWLGVPMNRISTTRPHEIFKIISEFALEYRTTRDRVLQQIKKINREKSRSRGYASADVNDVGMRKMNSKEAKDDARLKQLLQDESCYSDGLVNASTWRRQRRDTKNLVLEVNNNDEEILDALIKTANQVTSPRIKERRRSRIYGKH